MSNLIVIIMESGALARAIVRTLEPALGYGSDIVSMTYDKSLLSRDLLMRADLFILGLFRSHPSHIRAEGLLVAEKLIAAGRRSLLISNRAVSGALDCTLYWDIDAEDHLPARVLRVMSQKPPAPEDLTVLRQEFSAYCFPPSDGHHSRPR